MTQHKQFLATVLAVSLGIAVSGLAYAQGMQQENQATGGRMMGNSQSGMMGQQGSMGPGVMGQQGGMGPGMMGQQGGMGPGMMGQQSGMGPGMMMGGQGGIGHGMMGGMGPGMMMGGQAGILDEEQQRSLRQMRKEFRTAHFERMAEMMNLRDDMMQLMQAPRPDPEEVQALHGQMAALQGEMMADRVRMRNRMQDMLTDEQRQQMRQGASPRNNSQ